MSRSPRIAAAPSCGPENGLTAFRNALALGADYLELDTHLTADGEVVVIHDPTLDRTTTGRGPVSARRLAELADTRLKGADGSVTEDTVPTLAQVLDTLKPRAPSSCWRSRRTPPARRTRISSRRRSRSSTHAGCTTGSSSWRSRRPRCDACGRSIPPSAWRCW
jgi:hypothetical protein